MVYLLTMRMEEPLLGRTQPCKALHVNLLKCREKYMSDIDQFIRFCIAGFVNTFLNLFVMFLLLKAGINILICSSFGFIVGAGSGYFFNFYFTFRNQENFFRNFLIYFPLQVCCLGLTLIIVYYSFNTLNFQPLMSQIFAIIITTFINFFARARI